MERIQIGLHQESANQSYKSASHPSQNGGGKKIDKHCSRECVGIRVKVPVEIRVQPLYNPASLFLDTDPRSPMLIMVLLTVASE